MGAQALPDTEGEVLARLRELEAELQPLAEQKRKIDARARRCRCSPLKSCNIMPLDPGVPHA